MITTTLNRIRAYAPCAEGWAKLLAGLGKTEADDEPLPYAEVVRINGIDDALWACRSEPQHAREWRLFAVWCARRVQHLMTDPRSIAALDIAERHANGTATDAELDAAQEAAQEAARHATREAARHAARHATREAARHAARHATREAAQGAARHAAWQAAQGAQGAAQEAAWAVARDAARAATWDVAWAAQEAAWQAARAEQTAEFLHIVGDPA